MALVRLHGAQRSLALRDLIPVAGGDRLAQLAVAGVAELRQGPQRHARGSWHAGD